MLRIVPVRKECALCLDGKMSKIINVCGDLFWEMFILLVPQAKIFCFIVEHVQSSSMCL